MTKDEILEALPKLASSDLQQVKAMVEYLTANSTPVATPTTPLSRLENEVFQAMQAELKNHGCYINYQIFKNTKYYKSSWKSGVKDIDKFLKKHFKDVIKTKTERLKLLRYLISILIDDLKERSIPITVGVVTSNIGNIPRMFEKSFPGYLESGLAYLVPIAMKGK